MNRQTIDRRVRHSTDGLEVRRTKGNDGRQCDMLLANQLLVAWKIATD
jgi:hypothetical protein